ncbi:MAG: hypothetical protein M5U09_01515 [Gammaproteobacteria bacterium]|nr:hypothetical protein [Gammaproteobacteria bacterium]
MVKEGVEFAKANGLPVSEGMISELVDGDTDNALPAIGRGVLDEFASRAGLSPSDVDAIADGRVADVLEAKAREEVHAAVTHFARKRGVDADAIALLETATSDEPGAALVELGVSKFPPEARSAVIALTSGDPYAAGPAVKQLATDELARELGPAAASALIGDGNFTGAAEAAVLERARRAGLDFVPEDATRIGDIDTEALTDDAIDEILRRSGLPIEARVLLPSLGAAAKGDAHARAALLRRAEDEILKEIGRQSAALESHVIDTITEAIAAMPVNVRDRVAELNERLAHTRDFRTAARLMAGEAFRDESERLAQTLEERERPELAGVVRSLANGDVARTLRLVVDGDFDPHVLTKLARSAAINELDRNISQSPAARAILGENIISRGGLGQQLVDGDIDGLGRLLHGRAQAQLGEARNRLVQDGLERIELARREIESHPDAPPALAGAVAVIETALRNGTPVSPGVLRERAERILAEVGLTDTEIDDALEGRPISAFARLAAAKAIRAVAGDDLLTATGAGQYAEKLTSLVRAEDPLAELAGRLHPDSPHLPMPSPRAT